MANTNKKTVYTRIQNKHDLEVNWMRATGFIPLDGELVYYDKEVDNQGNTLTIALNGETVPAVPSSIDSTKRSEPIPYARYKVGDGHTNINDLDFFDKTISGTVTKEIGGISKNKVYTDATVADVLSDLLFPYVAPTFSSISTTEAAGTFEYGTTKTISKVTPKFTLGSKPITSIKIGTTSGGSDLYSGTTAANNTAITLTNSKTFDGNTGGTIYCTISDGTTPLTKSATVSYTYYNYTAVTSSTTAPTTASATNNNGTSAEATITTTDNTYIWFLMPNQNKKQIQQYAMNQWNNMNTTYAGTVTFTTSTSKQVTYYAYRTDAMTAATEKYRIN